MIPTTFAASNQDSDRCAMISTSSESSRTLVPACDRGSGGLKLLKKAKPNRCHHFGVLLQYGSRLVVASGEIQAKKRRYASQAFEGHTQMFGRELGKYGGSSGRRTLHLARSALPGPKVWGINQFDFLRC